LIYAKIDLYIQIKKTLKGLVTNNNIIQMTTQMNISKPKKFKVVKKKMPKKEPISAEKKSMLKYNMHKLQFQDKVNVDNAKQLLKMSLKDFEEQVYDVNELNADGKKYSDSERINYFKQVKEFCKLAIASDGVISQEYKYSKRMMDSKVGRIYVNHFGIQSLQKKLRGFLSGEYHHDVDINNCFPSLLVWFIENNYQDIDISNLKKYVKKRSKLLEKYKTSKIEVLKWLNRDFQYTGDNTLIKCLDSEFKKIQKTLWEDKTNEIVALVNKKEITSTNKKGSLLHSVLSIIENDILQGVIAELDGKVKVPFYDGAFIDASEDKEEIISKLNDFTKKYNLTWSIKEHQTLDLSNINLDDDDDIVDESPFEEKLYGYEYIDYSDLKTKFEKNHTICLAPFMIIREYEDFYSYDDLEHKCIKYELHSESEFEKVYRNLYYHQKVMRNTGTKKKPNYIEEVVSMPFVKTWLEDPTRRTVKKMDFIPQPVNKNICPKNVYNMFKGFSAQMPKEKEYDFDIDNEVQRFINHIKLLVNFEEDSTNYVINYIADLVQNPQNLPEVALVFKSKQGLGKDLLIHYLEKIINSEHIYRTANLDEVYGNFNPAVKGKLIVQLNELEGKDGFAKKERLKDSITAPSLNINEKNIKQFKINNSIRFIIFSNNMNPIEIPADDRRFVVFRGAELLAKEKKDAYYNPLFDNLKNKDIINKIYEYFMNIDISDFNLRQHRPITSAYKQMREQCVAPIFRFCWDVFNDLYEYDKMSYPIRKHKKLMKHMVKTTDLHKLFEKWFKNVLKTEAVMNFKHIKPQLESIGIIKKDTMVGGVKGYYYIFDKDAAIEKLKEDHKFGEDNEDLLVLDDDFEDDCFLDSDDEE